MAKPIKPPKPVPDKTLKLTAKQLGVVFYYLTSGHVATEDQAKELKEQVEKAIEELG